MRPHGNKINVHAHTHEKSVHTSVTHNRHKQTFKDVLEDWQTHIPNNSTS